VHLASRPATANRAGQNYPSPGRTPKVTRVANKRRPASITRNHWKAGSNPNRSNAIQMAVLHGRSVRSMVSGSTELELPDLLGPRDGNANDE
jgi:hypothetical protein